MEDHREPKVFEYDGPVYVRPLGRGIVLEATETYLHDAIEALVGSSPSSGWGGRLRILVEAFDEGGETPPGES